MKNQDIFDNFKAVPKKERSINISTRGWNIIALCVMAIIINLVSVIYVCNSTGIYYWSTAESWNVAIKIAQGAYRTNLWGEVYNSIINLDFNFLSALPCALFIKIFGSSRLVYILSLANCYLISAYASIYFLAKKIGKAPIVTMFLTLFAIPAMFYMMIRGFSEIGGLFICIICINLYFDDNKRGEVIRGIAIGILTALVVLISNVYIFFSISFITAMIAQSIIFKQRFRKSVLALCTFALILLVFFGRYITGRITSLYGDASFNFNFILNTKFIVRYFGLVFMVAIIASSVYIFFKEKEKRMAFLWIQLAVCYIMLTATRMHGQLHILLYLPSIIALFVICVRYIKKEKVLVWLMILALLQTVSPFVARTQPTSVEEIKYYSLFPSFSMRYEKRDSSGDVLTLKRLLDDAVGEGEYLGVLSYSDIMNAELLNNVEISLNKHQYRRDYIAFTIPCFDSIIPDISPLCKANYMLVPTTVQTISDNQKILETATESFLGWRNIARAYEELYDYEMNIDGVDFKLFKRIRDVNETEKREFMQELNENLNYTR